MEPALEVSLHLMMMHITQPWPYLKGYTQGHPLLAECHRLKQETAIMAMSSGGTKRASL